LGIRHPESRSGIWKNPFRDPGVKKSPDPGSRIYDTSFYSEKCRGYFTPVLFAKLQQGDRLGRVSIMALFNYVMRKVWLHQTRIGLSLYDITGQGFLRESDLGK
jgi:hypothetical protein